MARKKTADQSLAEDAENDDEERRKLRRRRIKSLTMVVIANLLWSRLDDDVFSRFLNVTCRFIEGVREKQLKKDVLSCKPARNSQALDFDSLPRPRKYCHEKLIPLRNARAIVWSKQEYSDFDCEWDSLSSQSTCTFCVRLQEKFRVVGIKNKADNTPAEMREWMDDFARAELNEAGTLRNLQHDPRDLGGFKRAHVSD
jgi:hypothetical protein